jgi:DNA polymerase-3 subunit delta
MVAIKAADVDAFVARPDPARPVVLVFGPDAGLVSERVNAIVKASVDDVNDPFALARLEGETVAAEPTRLVEEAQTMPLFGGRRAVWLKAGSRNIAPAVEALLALPAGCCRVVIEAGDLRRNAPLRALCERAKNAVVLACYADNERDRAKLIDDEMRAAGLTLTAEARALLIPLLGGDRAASRSEIRKLALYAGGRGQEGKQVGVEDVAAVVSDASTLALEDVVDAAFAGRPGEVEAHLAKARTAGTSAGSLLFAAQRHVAQLHKWRLALDERSGFSLDAALPPGQFRRKTAIEAALRNWSAARLLSSMSELADATLESRRQSDLADTIAERALLAIASQGRRSAA